jgi:hypothetical protein
VTTQETFDCRDICTGTLLDIARADRDAIVVVNDSVGSSSSTNSNGSYLISW